MELYDEYVEYMEELNPNAETWVQEQIAEELYTRDNSIKSLRKRNTELEQEIERLRVEVLGLQATVKQYETILKVAEVKL
jgi:cell division protein FtsB